MVTLCHHYARNLLPYAGSGEDSAITGELSEVPPHHEGGCNRGGTAEISLHTAADGVVSSPHFPELEENILAYWKDDDTFQASSDNRPPGVNGENEYVFYDGPPFANGLPHYGHLLTGYVKDVIPRFRTMIGSRV